VTPIQVSLDERRATTVNYLDAADMQRPDRADSLLELAIKHQT